MVLPVQNVPAAADDAEHAQAVYEKRFWLRLSGVCNNRCVFCLDADHRPDGRFVPFHEVEQAIRKAVTDGYRRLILSGGEATIHPDFVKIIRCGRTCGFGSIQVITNGRMFSYASFATASLQAGLTETTFSIHGHTAALHDELTGVPGSFDQACQGIRNLTGRCIVNIDIVVTRQNVVFVDRIIQHFSEFGVHEYDLMHPVPFGRAFVNRSSVFFDHRDAAKHLARAFAFSRRMDSDYHIWTNRFPPHCLEGFEDLIQDPHKLHDEVEGRRRMLAGYVEGREFDCFPERCSLCFIRDLCREFRAHVAMARHPRRIARLTVTAPNDRTTCFLERCTNLRVLRLPLNRANLQQLRRLPALLAQLERLELPVEDLDVAMDAGALATPQRQVVLEWPTGSAAFPWRGGEWPTGVQHVQVLGAGTAQLLQSLPGDSGPPPKDRVFRLPCYERLSTARAAYAAVFPALAVWPSSRFVNCAPCLAPQGRFDCADWYNYDIRAQDGPAINLDELVRHFILTGYFVKSDRCSDCAAKHRCRGMHINFIRVFGFRCLQPIARDAQEAHG